MRALLVGYLLVSVFAGCVLLYIPPDCAKPSEVEKEYDVSTTCAGGGSGRVRVTNYIVSHHQDCPSGCFTVTRGDVEKVSGTLDIEGGSFEGCKVEEGRLTIQFGENLDEAIWCVVPREQLGIDVPCGHSHRGDAGCTLRAVLAPD